MEPLAGLSQLSDEQLLEGVTPSSGDSAERVADLYRRHGGNVIGYFRNRRQPGCDPEELAQAVWVKVLTRSGQFHGGKFTSWLYTIAGNELTDCLRRKRRAGETALRDEDRSVWDDAGDLDERIAALKDCIDTLEPEHSRFIRAFVAKVADGKSSREIMDEFGIAAEGTVHSQVARGKALIGDCLEKKLRVS